MNQISILKSFETLPKYNLNLTKAILVLTNDVLNKKLVENPKYKLRSSYKSKLKRTVFHICCKAFNYPSNSNFWIPVDLNEQNYSNKTKSYITYKTITHALKLLKSANVIEFKLGNKKLDYTGCIKQDNHYTTRGYQSSFRLNPRNDYLKVNLNSTTIIRKNNNEFKIRDKKTELINQYTKEWGFTYQGKNIEYKRIFNRKKNSRGRYYSNFQCLKRIERKKWLPPGFVENDYHASQLNILYQLITNDKFKLKNGEYGDCYLEVCNELGLPKEYRKIIKTFFLSLISTTRDKAIKSITYGLAKSGHYRSKFLQQYPEDKLNKWINSNNYRNLITMYFCIDRKIAPQHESVKQEFEQLLKKIRFIKKQHNQLGKVKHQFLKPELILQAILKTHNQISYLFFQPKISELITYIESEITFNVIQQCYFKDIKVLSIHDAYYSHSSKSIVVKELMNLLLKQITNKFRIKLFNNIKLIIDSIRYTYDSVEDILKKVEIPTLEFFRGG